MSFSYHIPDNCLAFLVVMVIFYKKGINLLVHFQLFWGKALVRTILKFKIIIYVCVVLL